MSNRPITFTTYFHIADVVSIPETKDWSEWVQVLTKHDVRGTPSDGSLRKVDPTSGTEDWDTSELEKWKDGPCIVVANIPQGKRRLDKEVIETNAIGIDIERNPKSDESADAFEAKVVAGIERLNEFEYVAYSTHAHRAPAKGGALRMRIILPLLRPLTPAEHRPFWNKVCALIGGVHAKNGSGICDVKCKNPSRALYLPSTYDPSLAETAYHQGRWLDPDSDLQGEITTTKESSPSDNGEAGVRKARAIMRAIPKGDPVKDASVLLLAGAPFAEPGERHETLVQLTWWLARKNRELSLEVIKELFEAPLMAMAAATGEGDDVEAAWNSYQTACTKIDEDRELERAKKEHKAKEKQLASVGATGEYSEEDLRAIATKQGWEVEDLKHRWIIQKDMSFWYLGSEGHYIGPYSQAEARPAAAPILARAPIMLSEPTQTGLRRKPMAELVEEYGSVAVHVLADLATQTSWFDAATYTMNEAVRPLRKIEPKFDKTIETWLKLLGGHTYDKLADWLACAPDLDKLLCALYFGGEAGGGKTAFAHGLAKLWTKGGPTEFKHVLKDSDNEAIAKCPVVFADEKMPKGQNNDNVTAILRQIVSTRERTFVRKYKGPASLTGALRVILAANNDSLLETKDALTRNDLNAIGQRILFIEVTPDCREFIETLADGLVDSWIRDDIFAAHVLHMAKSRTVVRGKRFWVDGEITGMHRSLVHSSFWNSKVCELLVRFCLNPSKADTKRDGLLRAGSGRLLVNPQGVIDGWRLYLPDTKAEADTNKIGQALRAISMTERIQLRWQKTQRIRYHEIDVTQLLAWADQVGIGDEDAITATINRNDEEIVPLEGNNVRTLF